MYKSLNHSCFSLKLHVVLVVKYRRNILFGKLDKDLKEIIRTIETNSDFEKNVMESDKNHIHILIDSVPTLSPLQIVRKIKQESTFSLWKLNENILKNYFWNEKTLWTDGYFVCSTGDACLETIMKYIENQGSNSSPKLKT